MVSSGDACASATFFAEDCDFAPVDIAIGPFDFTITDDNQDLLHGTALRDVVRKPVIVEASCESRVTCTLALLDFLAEE